MHERADEVKPLDARHAVLPLLPGTYRFRERAISPAMTATGASRTGWSWRWRVDREQPVRVAPDATILHRAGGFLSLAS